MVGDFALRCYGMMIQGGDPMSWHGAGGEGRGKRTGGGGQRCTDVQFMEGEGGGQSRRMDLCLGKFSQKRDDEERSKSPLYATEDGDPKVSVHMRAKRFSGIRPDIITVPPEKKPPM